MGKLMRFAILAVMVLMLEGCATIMEGTGQSISISTNPPGAICAVDREGRRLGQVSGTPGSIRIDKSGKDLQVSCAKSGYALATVASAPKFNGTAFDNILMGGVIGAFVDASTSANYEYPAQFSLDLAPLQPMPPPAAPMPQVELLPRS